MNVIMNAINHIWVSTFRYTCSRLQVPKREHLFALKSMKRCYSDFETTACNANLKNNFENNILSEKEFIIKNSVERIEFKNVHLAKYILDSISRFGTSVALINGETGKHITYSELECRILKTANILLKLGLKKGDVVTLYSPNDLDYPVVVLGVLLVGAICSTVNNFYTADELMKTVVLSQPSIIITSPHLASNVDQILPHCPFVKDVLLIGDESVNFLDKNQNDVFTHVKDFPIDMDDVAYLPFSSGTTGFPKGVQLTHRNIVYNMQQTLNQDRLDYVKSDHVLSVLPNFHVYGYMVVMSGLWAGLTQIVMSKFDPSVFLNCLHKYQCSYLFVVPPILLFLSRHPLVSNATFPHVRRVVSGAAPATKHVMDEVKCKLNKDSVVKQAYGLTETSPVITMSLNSFNKEDSVGPVVPHTELKIIDDTGNSLPRNKRGEICVRGPQVMKGYFENEEANKQTFTHDGWLKTGDVGSVDQDDCLYIVDRSKELIKVKGFQVAPAELESILLSHPFVADAAVIGVPDEKLGEIPRAYVVLKTNASIKEDDLVQFTAEKVAPFKRLQGGVHFITEIPKSPSGKILRRILKEQFT